MIDSQYFKDYLTNSKNAGMHDLYSIYVKVRRQLKLVLKQNLVQGENLKNYRHKPKMSDLEILSLSITSEALGIDSENLLWSKIKKDYADRFPHLIHRTRYNARRKSLSEWLIYVSDQWSNELQVPSSTFIVDSIPIPVCKIVRERSSTVCRKFVDQVKASKGWSSANRQYYIGYKLHLITCESGAFQECRLWPANVHDIHFLKHLTSTHLNQCQLIGDRAYRSEPLQLALFDTHQIDLQVPYRRNQNDYTAYPETLKIKRKRIETVFSQYCDEYMIKRNYAKSYLGIKTRIYSKIAAMTFKQYWNHLKGNPISRTKHALAA